MLAIAISVHKQYLFEIYHVIESALPNNAKLDQKFKFINYALLVEFYFESGPKVHMPSRDNLFHMLI